MSPADFAAAYVCFQCGSSLQLIEDAETETMTWCPNPGGMPYMKYGLRPAKILACTGCEICVEVRV